MRTKKVPDEPSGAKPSQREVDDALVAVIASTKRKRRKLNPLEVAEKLALARAGLDDAAELSERVGLSEEMIRQILSVRRCAPRVKQLAQEGKITSFDILHRLSKLCEDDQERMAQAVIRGELDSDDVRALVGLRKSFPHAAMEDLIHRVRRSRNVKQYVAYFAVPNVDAAPSQVRRRILEALGEANIISMRMERGIGELIMSREGKERLQKQAARARKTKRDYLQYLACKR